MKEEEFKEANKQYESFKEDLIAVLKKHNVLFIEHDQYNGMEQYMGCELYPEINGTCLYRDTISELLKEFIK